MKNRLFIALEVPHLALQQICKIRDENIDNAHRLKWEPIEKLHFTLKFLGDIDVELNEKIISSMYNLIERHSIFECEFNHFGLFKRGKIPSIFWIGLKDNEKLTNIVNDIESEMFNLGFPKENRPFKPHLTLLRIKSSLSEDFFKKILNISLPLIKFTTENISLMKSELLPSGSVYTKIKEFKLK